MRKADEKGGIDVSFPGKRAVSNGNGGLFPTEKQLINRKTGRFWQRIEGRSIRIKQVHLDNTRKRKDWRRMKMYL